MTAAQEDARKEILAHARVLFIDGNGWTHAWLSMHLEAADVTAALAEIGLAPDYDLPPRPMPTLIYRRELTHADRAMIVKAARLARMRSAHWEGQGTGGGISP